MTWRKVRDKETKCSEFRQQIRKKIRIQYTAESGEYVLKLDCNFQPQNSTKIGDNKPEPQSKNSNSTTGVLAKPRKERESRFWFAIDTEISDGLQAQQRKGTLFGNTRDEYTNISSHFLRGSDLAKSLGANTNGQVNVCLQQKQKELSTFTDKDVLVLVLVLFLLGITNSSRSKQTLIQGASWERHSPRLTVAKGQCRVPRDAWCSFGLEALDRTA